VLRDGPPLISKGRTQKMRTITAVVSAFAALLALASTASANTWVHEDAQVSIWVPNKWKMDKDGPVVTISDPREEVALVFFTLPARDLTAALESLDEELEKFVKNIRVSGDPQEATINGMPAVTIDATGRVDGKRVELSIAVLRTPSRKALVILGVAESAKLRRHERTLTRIITSLKPARRR
jgi:predicted Zn-dependent protease